MYGDDQWERTHGKWAPGLQPTVRVDGFKVVVDFVGEEWVASFQADPDIKAYGATFEACIAALSALHLRPIEE